MEQMTTEQARQTLDEWAAMMRDRDRRIATAARAGLTKLEISRRMGISPNTVYAGLRRHREQASDGS